MRKKIVIVGGGTAGWMTASAFAVGLGSEHFEITLVESESVGIVGVGEATTPPIRRFNQYLGINEVDFMNKTNATFKLGIKFVDWGKEGQSYFHPFGTLTMDEKLKDYFFYLMPYWLRSKREGGNFDYSKMSFETEAARENKFGESEDIPKLNYAYHFDAVLYAKYLKEFSCNLGVTRIEGKITSISKSNNTGAIESIFLESGKRIDGQFFIDCSGFKGLLISETLGSKFRDWGSWLPVNSAIAVQSTNVGKLTPYTTTTAMKSGWRWKIPLQHRTGNGYVYSNHFIDDEAAKNDLIVSLDGEVKSDPRLIRFKTGMRECSWINNCVAIGLSSGFLEPLESTSIHLIQVAIFKLLEMFPLDQMDPLVINRFNCEMSDEYSSVRDLIIAHYKVSKRDGSMFWQSVREMNIPDSLQEKLALFKERGEVLTRKSDFFQEPSWFSVLMGQGLIPEGFSPKAFNMSEAEIVHKFTLIRSNITQYLAHLPDHRDHVSSRVKVEPQ